MKFKLDENFGKRTQQLFQSSGHDVCTAREEGLSGATDEQIFVTCSSEARCLVTLDRDFCDITRFPPDGTAGIVVIRVPRNPSLRLLESLIEQLFRVLAESTVARQLWVVEPGRVRIHQPGETEAD